MLLTFSQNDQIQGHAVLEFTQNLVTLYLLKVSVVIEEEVGAELRPVESLLI